MTPQQHYQALAAMYHSAPINAYYPPRVEIDEGRCTIEIDVRPDYCHAAGAVHGSVYFKLLDDAAFFAANSIEPEVFVLTTSFTTYITRPVSAGVMRAEGRLLNFNRSQFIAEAVIFDSEQREIARGNGIFVRSKNQLMDVPGYRDAITGAAGAAD
ncbi:MAG: PaaI family thioesterase [Salinisphaeraceae bacterium]|nr:PaaI family thioesterase [Salinisphaeraceae bacterium]